MIEALLNPLFRIARQTLAMFVSLSLFLTLSVSGQSQDFKLSCSVTGPDSIFFDKVDYNRYLPGTFTIDIEVIHAGSKAVDSLYAFPRSNQRFTVIAPSSKLLAVRFEPGDTVRTDFTLQVNPRSVSGLDTITVSVSGKEGARSDCLWIVWVEKEYKPDNMIICPPPESFDIRFIDTLASYDPDPIPIPLTVINNGDAPSKGTRLFFASAEGVTLATGQNGVLSFGTLPPAGRIDTVFYIRAIERFDNITVTLPFSVQGNGGLGDKIIEDTCSFDIDIPPIRQVFFELDCESAPEIAFIDGRYVPNPFDWTVVVRNTGDSRAKNVRAVIALPVAYYLDGTSATEIVIGDMAAHSETTIQWRVHASAVYEPDSSEICVRVFDQFNRMAECCDSLFLPAVRAPEISASCLVLPDTVRVDRQSGVYLPSEFTVDVTVRNTGTDPADSVYAEILVTDPDVRFVAPPVSRVLLSTEMLPSAVETMQWRIAPLPVALPRDLNIRVRISSAKQPTVSTMCAVHVEAALAPLLTCEATTMPEDTLHYALATLEYDALTFSATLRNSGSISAKDVEATILLPPNISLPTSEASVKYLGDPLARDSSWQVSWQLLPEKKRDGTLDTIRVEFRSGSLSTVCGDWIFIVGIPPVTVFTIPSDIVERYGREFTTPILIDESQDKDISDIELFVTYDSELIEFLGWKLDSTLLEDGWNIGASGGDGRISFHAVTNDSTLQGTGALIRMHYRVRFGSGDDILRWDVSPLVFDSLASKVNRGSVLARYYNGQAIVSGDCLYPLKATRNFVISSSPNPFNPVTHLHFHLPTEGVITLLIYDALGREVARLHDGNLSPGDHVFAFDAHALGSGGYFAVLLADGRPMSSHRLLLLR